MTVVDGDVNKITSYSPIILVTCPFWLIGCGLFGAQIIKLLKEFVRYKGIEQDFTLIHAQSVVPNMVPRAT